MAQHYNQLKKVINKAYLKLPLTRGQIELFKNNLIILMNQFNTSEGEEFHKNAISDFLKNTYYNPNHYINTRGRFDLVIHNGKDNSSKVGVIFECKSPSNINEMPTPTNLNVKGIHELILYFLEERIANNNLELKHLVATNLREWFIIDAHVFEKLIASNKALVKQFNDFKEGRLSGRDTSFFYNSIAAPFLQNVEELIEFTHFDITPFYSLAINTDLSDDNLLIPLFKVLSPEHLLKLQFKNDSNSLDKDFYLELLYIIGLEETKKGNKKIIGRGVSNKRNPGSLIENTISILNAEDLLYQIQKPLEFGENRDEQLFNVALELVITWINRILFLKLLEGQLIKYNQNDKRFRFLNSSAILDFDALNKLFFYVLAVPIKSREDRLIDIFRTIPYLNSSLFEVTELERKTIRISNLDDSNRLPLFKSTVLKDSTGKKITGDKPTLHYLLDFLDSFDFSSEGGNGIQEENKTLINASVLGLIFEKINGYKDGSFFTPGYITHYMCHETITNAVIKKFNVIKGWNCHTITELHNKIENIYEANRIINSLKVCDPAVGSGHFLVSALNEIIALKSDLRILTDRNGKLLREYKFEVVNDELIISDPDGEPFEYNPRNSESQRVQEAIFYEKQSIIEGSLFGVDINPNSVKICRLRLWIELLKHAYYKQNCLTPELETLPNIDINIKCGNSLISRYTLDANIKDALKSSKWTVDNYREAVMLYRNADSKEQKKEMEKLISEIKNNFESEVSKKDKRFLRLNRIKGDLLSLTAQQGLFKLEKTEKDIWNRRLKNLISEQNKLENQLNEIKSSRIYKDAFEWRFEFPEVLSDDGDFIGFDVVIGNPPYIRHESLIKELKSFYLNQFPHIGTATADIYVYFFGRGIELLNDVGFLGFITLNKWLKTQYGKNLRNYLQNISVTRIIDFFELPVFEEASTDSAITFISKSPSNLPTQYVGIKSLLNLNLFLDTLLDDTMVLKGSEEWKFIKSDYLNLINKIESSDLTIGQYIQENIYLGIKTGFNQAYIISDSVKNTLCSEDPRSTEIIKPYLKPKAFTSNDNNWDNMWIIMSHNGIKQSGIPPINTEKDYPAVYNHLSQFLPDIAERGDKGNHWSNLRDCSYLNAFYTPKIIYVYTAKNHSFYYDEDGFIVNNSCFIISTDSKVIWAFLNSSLFKFYQRIKFVAYGDADTHGRVKLDRNKMLSIPIKVPDDALKFDLETKLSNYHNIPGEELQKIFDEFINSLYNLSHNEIALLNN